MFENIRTKEQRLQAFRTFMIGGFTPSEIDELAVQFDRLGFFEAPASTKYHGAFEGGLCLHSLCVGWELVRLTEKLGLTWERPRSPYLVGIGHDLCKHDQYEQTPEGIYRFRQNLPLVGHGEKSVIELQRVMALTEEEMLCIRWHMGGYDDSKNYGSISAAIEKTPNVIYTHTADMIASHVHGL